jgi:pilus assembly protein Flp/PilA
MLELYTQHIARRLAELARRRPGQRGQGMVEYGLILVLVSIAVVIALTALGGQLNSVFNYIKNGLVT